MRTSIACVVSLFLCQTLALADAVTPPVSVNDWVRPLLGKHSLAGDPTCENLILEQTGGTDSPNSYTVYTVTDGAHQSNFTNDLGSKVSGPEFTYQNEHNPDMPCGDRSKTKVLIEKDGKGNLSALSFKTSQASGCIYFWHTAFSVNCKAK